MKESEVPQDRDDAYQGYHKIRYARSECGEIKGYRSNGWQVEREVMDVAWGHLENRMMISLHKARAGQLSPLAYHMERALLEPRLLAQNVGLWTWQVKRHLRPKVFRRLRTAMLRRYAEYFEISVESLCSLPGEDA